MGFTWSSGARRSLRFVLFPHPRRSDLLPRQQASRRCRTRACKSGGPRHDSASYRLPKQGKDPDRSCGSLAVRRCPPRPSNALPRSDPRGPSTGPPRRHFRTDARDPPDLGATFPDASRSLRPGCHTGLPLMGLSKDRPSIVQAVESDSQAHIG